MQLTFYVFSYSVEQPYISCKGSAPYLRGYPCGIWLLFHSLTVQEYLKQTNTSVKKTNFTLPPHTVLRTMKGYITNFFPCDTCVQNFDKDTVNLEAQLVHPNSSIIWLWQEHNKINLLLKNVSNDDPEWPKQAYPAYECCKKCYLNEPGKLEKLDDLNRMKWNQTEVVEFLIKHYRKESMIKSTAIPNNLSTCLFVLLIIYQLLSSRLLNRTI